VDNTPVEPPKTYGAPKRPLGTGKGMKLGSKSKDESSFVAQLASEGVEVAEISTGRKAAAPVSTVADINKER